MVCSPCGRTIGIGVCLSVLALAGTPFGQEAGGGRVLRVGHERALKTPARAAALAQDGDVVEIDAGTYEGDAAVWRANRLILRGVGGRARVVAAGAHAEGKA